MIFPYLSPTPPEMHSMREIIRCPAAYRIHGSFCPSVVLTEPSFDGSLIMLRQIFAYAPVAVRLLQASCRSDPFGSSPRSLLL